MFKEFRGQTFTWFGIIGGALTITNQWSNFLPLSDWQRYLVEYWGNLLHSFWSSPANMIGATISKDLSIRLSMTVFIALIVLGTVTINGLRNYSSYKMTSNGNLLLYAASMLSLVIFALYLIAGVYSDTDLEIIIILLGVFVTAYSMDGDAGVRLYTACLYVSLILLALPYSGWLEQFKSDAQTKLMAISLLTLVISPIFIVPTKPFSKRISYLLLGVAIMFGVGDAYKQVTSSTSVANTTIN